MSRLWAERIRVGLAPDRVELARFGRGRGRRPLKHTTLACEPEAGQAPWQAALEALDGALAGFASRRDTVAVVLSNAFVRYLVLPWQPEISSVRELTGLAPLRFQRTFGEAAAGWTIRCSIGGYGEASVACAIDTALITALRERLSALKLRLVSVQPLLMAAYNDVRDKLAPNNAFATIERGRVCLSVMRKGRWSHIASRRAVDDPADAIEQELAAIPSEVAPEQLDVLLVGDGASWPQDGARPARLLRGPEAGGCSLALCGAG